MSENRTSAFVKQWIEWTNPEFLGDYTYTQRHIRAILEKYQKMEEALESCDLIVIGQHFPDKLRVIQDALSFDPLTSL